MKVSRRDIGLGALGMTTGSLLLTLTLGISPAVPTALAAAPINVIGVGGTGDSQGTRIFDKLNGFSADPLIYNDQGLPYAAVYYPINQSTDAAVPTLEQQIAADQGQTTAILAYSQGTIVVVKWLKKHDGEPVSPDMYGIILIAAPNTPNGGIYARYPWLEGNPIAQAAGFDFNGAVPNDTGIPITIVNRQYDPYGDSPLDPLNPLADLNSLVAIIEVHPDRNYDNIDLNNLPPGTTTQYEQSSTPFVVITVPNEHLPLLMPFYQVADAAGVKNLAAPILDLVEPVLTWGVELGYDRTLPPDVAAPAQPGSSLTRLPGALPDLPGAIQQGVQKAVADLGNIGSAPFTAPDPSKLPPLPGASALTVPSVVSTPSVASTPSVTPNASAPSTSSTTTGNPVKDVVDTVTKPVKDVVDKVTETLTPKHGSSTDQSSSTTTTTTSTTSTSTTGGGAHRKPGSNPVRDVIRSVTGALNKLGKPSGGSTSGSGTGSSGGGSGEGGGSGSGGGEGSGSS